jgi:branched-chain amino acid transport system substrate-binding protein
MRPILSVTVLLSLGFASAAHAADPFVPVLVPVTGFLAVEGASQRDGAILALTNPPAGVKVRYDVSDTGTSPEVAVNAFARATGDGAAIAVVAPMLGTQMLALLPVALDAKLPLLTISGTAAITQKGNPYIFRFFPDDATTKSAQVRFAIEQKHIKKPAIISQTDAYGQSGGAEIVKLLKQAGIEPAYQESVDVSVKDMSPIIAKAKAAGVDSLLLHLHGGSTALIIKAVANAGLDWTIVSGSAISQPATVELLDPAELKGVCGETGSSPVSAETPEIAKFLADYKAKFNHAPDAFSLAQFDATNMLLKAMADGAKTPEEVTKALSSSKFKGLGMTYYSDGKGNMAHSAVVICYDGKSRIPSVAKHYDAPTP